MTQLLQTIDKIRVVINPKLKVDGVLFTIADMQTRIARNTIEAFKKNYGSSIRTYKTIIPMGVKVPESNLKGQSLYSYDKGSKPAIAYEQFTREVLSDGKRTRSDRASECR